MKERRKKKTKLNQIETGVNLCVLGGWYCITLKKEQRL